MHALLVQDEDARLKALQLYEVLDTPTDATLDDITRLTAQICGTPMAGISLVEIDRVWFKSRIGIEATQVPRAFAPCDQTIEGDTIYEIPDATKVADYAPRGIPIDGKFARYYAGAPLVTPDGVTVGALFVMDTKERTLDAGQLSALQILGRQVITRMEFYAKVRALERQARQRARIESALTVERNFVSAVLDTVGALVLVIDTAGRVVRFNRTCENISGYQFTQLQGRPFWEQLIPKEDFEETIATFEKIRNGGYPAAYENRWLARDGSVKRIAWSATALLDAQNQVAFIIATGIDVTVQREAEQTLRESEARYRQLVEGSLGMVCTHDLEGKLLSVNQHTAESLDYAVDEMVGQPLVKFIDTEYRENMGLYLQQMIREGESQGLLHLCHRSGDVHVIAYRNKLIEMEGRAPYVLGFGVDITEKIEAEEKLNRLTRQSDSILESVGDGIYGTNLDGKVTIVNPAAAEMLGYKVQELLGQDMHTLSHHTKADGTPNPSESCMIRQSLLTEQTVRVADEIFWRKDGTSFPVEYVARPQISDGKAVGVVVAFTDVTERRALDKMKDEFISTVSHELRTPLTALRAALGLVAGGALASKPEKMHQMVEIALGNTDRLVRLVNDILDLERIGSGKAQLHSTMNSVEDLMRRAVELQSVRAEKAHVQFSIAAEGVSVWADPDRILQMLANLIGNAIKFSPNGGEIHLVARNLSDNEAQIEVHDQGRGIPQDKLEQIFERFQQVDASDSRAMGGTGLGLAICRSIAQQHGGRIWAESAPGKGASFFFTLPTRPRQNLR
ncbi:MAG: PAS domain S-box protein [Acidobacteriaceae bacterium]|nr:PAS domain S-box protein [Acidobacteriaceae bacterium]